jgi:excisionase family DNA binding protein
VSVEVRMHTVQLLQNPAKLVNAAKAAEYGGGDREEFVVELHRTLKAAQISAALGVSVDSVGRYARAGQIPFATTPGGHRLFNLDEVRQALAPSGRAAAREVFDVPVSTLRRRQRRAIVTASAGATSEPDKHPVLSRPAPSAAVADLVRPARRVLRASTAV